MIELFLPYDPHNPVYRDEFCELFTAYLDELTSGDPDDAIPKHIIPKLIRIIGEEIEKYSEWLYLCMEEETMIGFTLFQIDTPDNPLCKRPGWGFIREFYIVPERRRLRYAGRMCAFAEQILRENGAEQIYLTADESVGASFWERMGYTFVAEYDDKNGNRIYIK